MIGHEEWMLTRLVSLHFVLYGFANVHNGLYDSMYNGINQLNGMAEEQ